MTKTPFIEWTTYNSIKQNQFKRGFTTIRDIAGNTIGLKRAINMEILHGPRMYTSGPALGPTGGHSDNADSRGIFKGCNVTIIVTMRTCPDRIRPNIQK